MDLFYPGFALVMAVLLGLLIWQVYEIMKFQNANAPYPATAVGDAPDGWKLDAAGWATVPLRPGATSSPGAWVTSSSGASGWAAAAPGSVDNVGTLHVPGNYAKVVALVGAAHKTTSTGAFAASSEADFTAGAAALDLRDKAKRAIFCDTYGVFWSGVCDPEVVRSVLTAARDQSLSYITGFRAGPPQEEGFVAAPAAAAPEKPALAPRKNMLPAAPAGLVKFADVMPLAANGVCVNEWAPGSGDAVLGGQKFYVTGVRPDGVRLLPPQLHFAFGTGAAGVGSQNTMRAPARALPAGAPAGISFSCWLKLAPLAPNAPGDCKIFEVGEGAFFLFRRSFSSKSPGNTATCNWSYSGAQNDFPVKCMEWVHFAAVTSLGGAGGTGTGGVYSVYLDGRPVMKNKQYQTAMLKTAGRLPVANTLPPISVGRSISTAHLSAGGAFSDFRIWNTRLSDQQVASVAADASLTATVKTNASGLA